MSENRQNTPFEADSSVQGADGVEHSAPEVPGRDDTYVLEDVPSDALEDLDAKEPEERVPDVALESDLELEGLVGTVLENRYEIHDELARGGMGVVFRGQHKALNRPVVIKVLKSGQTGSETARARFEREARRACQLDHPNIVTVHDFGYHRGLGYLVMEYVDGVTVLDYLKNYGAMTFTQFAPVAAAVLSGLEEAHRNGIIHRDIKASNIMLTFEGDYLRRVKILDFGLAKVAGAEEDEVTKKSDLIGTMGAMPPERILCKETDQRVDLYAFGVCAYRMISGRRPFVGDDMHVLYQHVHEHPPPLTDLLPEDHQYPLMVLEFVHRLLAKDPNDRPFDAGEARQWLFETLQDTTVFRLDEQEVPWLMRGHAHVGSSMSTGSIEVRDPSWSSRDSGSFQSVITSERSDAAEVVAQLRAQNSETRPSEGLQERPALPTMALLVVAAAVVLGGAATWYGLSQDESDASAKIDVNAETPAAVAAENPSQAEREAEVKGEEEVEIVFNNIEKSLKDGNYGTAKALLFSLRDTLAAKPEYQIRAAEFQTRIKIGQRLRKAKQAEEALQIEEAIRLYDDVLSLHASNELAQERLDQLASSVVLKVRSKPDGELYLDGKLIGETPIEKLVPADFARVEVRRPGFTSWSKTLVPEGGRTLEVSAELRRPQAPRPKPPEETTSSISNDSLMQMDP